MLLRVKLLRALGLRIDTIKSLAAGTLMLGDALDARLEELHAEQENLDAAGRVAAGLRQAHAEFSTLDAAGYLGELLAASQTALRQDVKPYVHAPVRRYIARSFDLLLCSLPWYLVLQAAGVDPKARLTSIWLSILGMVTMLVLEPLLLHLFGTTPGKWLMGLRVTDENGQRAAACRRMEAHMACPVVAGTAAFIPVYSIVRLYTSWKAEQAEQPLEWEDGSELRAAPWKAWRGAAWAAAVLALLAATVLVGLKTCQPTHTGDLTVRKFAENYDYIHSTEGLLSRELYDDGTWAPATQLGFQVIHHTKNVPNLSYTTKDGSLIDISLHMGAEACTSPVYGLPFRELYLTMLAFDGARTAASADEALAAAARQLLDEPLQELHTGRRLSDRLFPHHDRLHRPCRRRLTGASAKYDRKLYAVLRYAEAGWVTHRPCSQMSKRIQICCGFSTNNSAFAGRNRNPADCSRVSLVLCIKQAQPAPGHAQKPGRPQRSGPVLIAFVQSTISTLTF
ncbi:MAG: RDD family protein [Acutalibacteraceae bacterium]